jgi:hypothetical protein
MSTLTAAQQTLLQDIVDMHEKHGTVELHGNMAAAEQQIVTELSLRGLLEVRPTAKGMPMDRRIVVPTPVGRSYLVTP